MAILDFSLLRDKKGVIWRVSATTCNIMKIFNYSEKYLIEQIVSWDIGTRRKTWGTVGMNQENYLNVAV